MGLFTSNLDLDIQILQNGAISMYYDMNILDSDLQQLKKLGYRIIDIDTENWTTHTAHKEIKSKMNFPNYYLAAFDDCLGDMNPAEKKGLIIVFRHYDHLAKTHKEFCEVFSML